MKKFKVYILNKLNILLKLNIYYIKIFNVGLEIYFNHAPILIYINNSIILLKNNNINNNFFYIFNSILKFNNNKLILITDNLIKCKDLNKINIINKKRKIEKKILNCDKNNNLIKYLYYINKINIYIDYLKLIKYNKNLKK